MSLWNTLRFCRYCCNFQNKYDVENEDGKSSVHYTQLMGTDWLKSQIECVSGSIQISNY